MSEEDAIDVLKNSIADYVISEYCEKCSDYTVCENRNEDCYFTQAIDTVVNLIKKQSKMINLMAEHLTTPVHDKNWVIKYFEDEVKLENEI